MSAVYNVHLPYIITSKGDMHLHDTYAHTP